MSTQVTKSEKMLKKCLTVLTMVLFSLTFAQQSGKASWYGVPHHGRKAADGSVFNMNAMTCASNTHALGSKLKVTNKENGKSVIVKVTDRGAFTKLGRIIDLSKGAFSQIASTSKGIITVLVEVVD